MQCASCETLLHVFSGRVKASDCATNMQDDIFGHRSSRNRRSARYAPSGGVRLRLRPNAQKSGSSGDVSCSSPSSSPETFCSSLQAFVLLSSRVAFQRTFRSLPSPLFQLQASQPTQTKFTLLPENQSDSQDVLLCTPHSRGCCPRVCGYLRE